MTMVEQRIQQQFYESADLTVQLAESLARPISEAATAIVGAITAGGKVLAFGSGSSFVDAQRFVAAFVGRFERERPSLAAISLVGDSVLATTLLVRDALAQAAAKQLQALGAPDDVLLIVEADATSSSTLTLIAAAREKEMIVVALTGRPRDGIDSALGEADVLMAVAHDRAARVREIHVLALHCLCDAVDLQLMGEQDLT